MPFVSQKTLESVPAHSVFAMGRAAVGAAVGLLAAGRMQRNTRNATALALLAIGVVVNLPSIIDSLNKFINGPESSRGLKRRLRSIRRDVDVPTEESDDHLY